MEVLKYIRNLVVKISDCQQTPSAKDNDNIYRMSYKVLGNKNLIIQRIKIVFERFGGISDTVLKLQYVLKRPTPPE